jgi:predicted nucleic acid-binding Zn ribbon protein
MTYLYETVPVLEGDPVVHYEIEQNMSDLPLTQHPETGEIIRRVILGGWGIGTSTPNSSCCGPKGCC